MSYFRPKSNRGAAWGPKRRAKIVHNMVKESLHGVKGAILPACLHFPAFKTYFLCVQQTDFFWR